MMAPILPTDEKSSHQEKSIHDPPSMPRSPASPSRLRRILIIFLILAIALPIGRYFSFSEVFDKIHPIFSTSTKHPYRHHNHLHQLSLLNTQAGSRMMNEVAKLVPLEVHIMSKCPDARDCLRDLIVPTMEKVSDKVDLKLSFIGSIDSNDDIHCKHGATECLGNIIILCAQELYPNRAVISLGFSNCLLASYNEIPQREHVESCALEHGIDFEELNSCVSDVSGKGMDLLRESIKRSEAAGVRTSATVRVRGKVWCVRDGGEWKDCVGGHGVDDLVEEILNS